MRGWFNTGAGMRGVLPGQLVTGGAAPRALTRHELFQKRFHFRTGAPMARRKKDPEPQPSFAEIQLGSAVVRWDEVEGREPVDWWSQHEAEVALGVTDRTLRNWAEIGLPVRKGAHGRPIAEYTAWKRGDSSTSSGSTRRRIARSG